MLKKDGSLQNKVSIIFPLISYVDKNRFQKLSSKITLLVPQGLCHLEKVKTNPNVLTTLHENKQIMKYKMQRGCSIHSCYKILKIKTA